MLRGPVFLVVFLFSVVFFSTMAAGQSVAEQTLVAKFEQLDIKEDPARKVKLMAPPAPRTEIIKAAFPGDFYMPAALDEKNDTFTPKIMAALKALDITPANSVLVTSYCSDEICRYTGKFVPLWGSEFFELGGLAGFPFAGLTGIGAASHHAAEGRMFILYGPHVGLSAAGHWGAIERTKVGPAETTCCGAMMAATKKLKDPPAALDWKRAHLDFQQWFIESRLQNSVPAMLKEKIMNKDTQQEALPELVSAVYAMIRQDIVQIIESLADSGHCNVVALGFVDINSPQHTDDAVVVKHFEYYSGHGHVKDLMETLK